MSRGPLGNDGIGSTPGGIPGHTDARECLVIVLGQTRSSSLTSESFDRFLVTPLSAGGRVDIALCRCSGYAEDDGYFAPRASYVWEIPEPDSWNRLFDEVAGDETDGRTEDWRSLVGIRGNWLGEIDEAGTKRPGSAARCLYLRHHALAMIRALGLEKKYRWFILTRSDHLYRFDHPPLRLLDPRRVWIPRGEDYEGITDRHVVFAPAFLRGVLGVLDDLLSAPSVYRRHMAGRGDWHLESFLKLAFITSGMYRDTRRFPRVMYLVRSAETDTSWSKGIWDGVGNVFVKYPMEKSMAEADVTVMRRAGGWRAWHLQPTLKEVVDRGFLGIGPRVYGGVLACRFRLARGSHWLARGAAILGGVGACLLVAGVFGGSESLETVGLRRRWDTMTQTLLVHATVLLSLSTAMHVLNSDHVRQRLAQTGLALFVGVSLFGTGIGMSVATGSSFFEAVATLGGIILIAGWVFLFVIACRMWRLS